MYDVLVEIGDEGDGHHERAEQYDGGEEVGVSGQSQRLLDGDEQHGAADEYLAPPLRQFHADIICYLRGFVKNTSLWGIFCYG